VIKLYSKIDNRLLHIIYRKYEMVIDREDISPPNQFIQVSALRLPEGKTFRPHQHIWKEPSFKEMIAQESWCIISGKVEIYFFDTDGSLLTTSFILNPGDISITFEGGHNYKALEPSVVYEYKTGPYEGQSRDKVFL